MNKDDVLTRLLDHCEKHNLYVTYYHGISEKGYTDTPLLCANWNHDKLERIREWGESYFQGMVEFDFDDEWTSCGECNKAIRIQPDSYGWTPSFMWLTDYDIACHEHYEDCKDDLIDHYKNSTSRAVPYDFYPLLEKAGFVCYSPDEYCQRFETGFHPGQNDRPEAVAKDIENELPGYDYIFKIDSVGQFDVNWSVYLRKQEVDK